MELSHCPLKCGKLNFAILENFYCKNHIRIRGAIEGRGYTHLSRNLS